jgi:hypothetical protein
VGRGVVGSGKTTGDKIAGAPGLVRGGVVGGIGGAASFAAGGVGFGSGVDSFSA